MGEGQEHRAAERRDYLVDALAPGGWVSKGIEGHTARVLWEDASTGLSIALVRFREGSGIPRAHQHAANQFMYCLEGAYEYLGSGHLLRPGSFYVNPKDSLHGPTASREDSLLLEIYDGPAYYRRPDYYREERQATEGT